MVQQTKKTRNNDSISNCTRRNNRPLLQRAIREPILVLLHQLEEDGSFKCGSPSESTMYTMEEKDSMEEENRNILYL
jgi:hypothetical protein